MGRLDNRVAIVTGGTQGIGEQAVRKFAGEGAKVLYMGLEDAPQIAEELKQQGHDVTFSKGANMLDKKSIDAFVDETIKIYGRVDILYNHAGNSFAKPLEETTDEEWYRFMDLNLNNIMYTIRKVLPTMIKNKYGSVITTSSIAAESAWYPGGGGVACYCAAKAAQLGMIRSLAYDYGQYNIRFNAIMPGIIDTDVYRRNGIDPNCFSEEIPMRRPGKAEEVADLALFLASEESSYINGVAIAIDGGMLTR